MPGTWLGRGELGLGIARAASMVYWCARNTVPPPAFNLSRRSIAICILFRKRCSVAVVVKPPLDRARLVTLFVIYPIRIAVVFQGVEGWMASLAPARDYVDGGVAYVPGPSDAYGTPDRTIYMGAHNSDPNQTQIRARHDMEEVLISWTDRSGGGLPAQTGSW